MTDYSDDNMGVCRIHHRRVLLDEGCEKCDAENEWNEKHICKECDMHKKECECETET